MSDTNKDLEHTAKNTLEDFYDLLSVPFDAEESTIRRAYRKASVKWHPDKNPGDKAAADKFILLGQARDILIDPKLKGEYDRQRLRAKEVALRDELLNSTRRKMKEDLERREREGRDAAAGMKRKRADEMNEAEKQEAEIQRLAEDGKRRRKEAQERKRREEEEASMMDVEKSPEPTTQAPVPAPQEPDNQLGRTIKVRFHREGAAASWDKDKISAMFSKYGKIDSVVMGKDKTKKIRIDGFKQLKTTATVFIVYIRIHHAHAAVTDAPRDYPSLDSICWAGKEPDIKSPVLNGDATTTTANASTSTPTTNIPSTPSTPINTPNKSFRASFTAGAGLGRSVGTGTPLGTPRFSFSPQTPSLEEVTMMRLKQAEKKRLEEQIRREEAAEEAKG